MNDLPNEFKELVFRRKNGNNKSYVSVYSYVDKDGKKRTFETPSKSADIELFKACYFMGQTCGTMEPPEYNRIVYRETIDNFKVIIDDSRSFVQGYKLVAMKDGSFAYVRESDGVLLPYRFDIASDFNECGFAMVGFRGSVTWINTHFEYLGGHVWYSMDSMDAFDEAPWKGVGDFSGSKDAKVSPMVYPIFGGTSNLLTYLNVDGEFQKFKQYDGNISEECKEMFAIPQKKVMFRGIKDYDMSQFAFDDNGRLQIEDCIYFSRGFYVTIHDLIKISRERGWLQSIDDEVKHMLIEPVSGSNN